MSLKELYFMQKLVVGCDVFPNYHGEFYRNISTLGLAAIDNDVEMTKVLLKAGCDPNYNGTSTLFFDLMEYFDYDNVDYIYDVYNEEYNDAEYEGDDYYDYYYDDGEDGRYIGGVTVLHIACVEGSIGY